MQQPMTPLEAEAKLIARKAARTERTARIQELQGMLRERLNQQSALKVLPPEAQALISHWQGALNELAGQFVSDLKFRAANGKQPQINFHTTGAMAYMVSHRSHDALIELAEMVSGNAGISATSRSEENQRIEEEIAKIRLELGTLGAFCN